MLAGADNRLSTSKVTAAVWTVVVVWMLLTAVIYRLATGLALGDMAVSNDYLLLLGGPFASAVLAKGIVATRLANGTLQKSAAPDDAQLSGADLIRDDSGHTDLVDFQYSLFNLLALVVVVVLFVMHPEAGLPGVPAGLLALTGASAAAYVANKAVTTGTPQITRVDPSLARAGQTVTLLGSNLVATGADTQDRLPTVTVNDITAAVVGAPSASAVTVRVPVATPASPTGQSASVLLVSDAGGMARAQATLVVAADEIVLSQLAPTTAAPGSAITLSGRGFLAPQALPPADDVSVDIPLVVISTAASSATPGRELARVSATEATDTRLTFSMPAVSAGPASRLTVTIVRGSLTSAPLSLLLGTAPSPGGEPAPLGPRTVDAAEGFRLGSGVATVSAEPRPSAVTLTPPEPVVSWVESTRITLCETSQQLYSALELAVDTSASYGAASMDNKFSVAQTCDKLASSLYLVVRALKYSPLTIAKDITLTAEARTLLDNENYADFFMRFGDAFVTGIVRGGEYAAVLAIDSNSEDTTREIKNSLGLTGAFGDFSASVQTNVANTLKQHSQQLQVHVVTSSRGGAPAASPATTTDLGSAREADDILTAVRTFPATVDDSHAFPLTAQLSEYTELAMINPQGLLDYLYGPQGLLVVARKTLSDLAATRALLVAQLARARAVLSNPFGYITPPAELRRQFEQYQTKIQSTLDEMPAAAAEYAHHVAVYGDATGVKPRAITPPKKLEAPPRVPRPTYLIRSYVNNRALALSLAPPSNQPTTATAPATLELQPADPTDPRQLWVIPDLGAGQFTIQSAWSGEYASYASGIHTTRDADDASTKWTLWASLFRRDDAWVVAPASNAGGVMNAAGNQYGPRTPIILWGFNYGDNCYWIFEPHDPTTPPSPETATRQATTLNRPGVSGELRAWVHRLRVGPVVTVVGGFELGGWDVAAGAVQAAVVEPVDPLESGDLDLLDRAPWRPLPDQLGLEQPDRRLGKRVVQRVAHRADRRGDAGLGEPLGERDRRVLLGFKGRRNTLIQGGCRGRTSKRAGLGAGGTGSDAVAGAAAGESACCAATVLAVDRRGPLERGRGARVRCVGPGGVAVVP